MDSDSAGGGRINWRQVGILYRREVRSALREKTVVINSILIPLFLYPFILWLMITGFGFVMGQVEGKLSRVEIRNWPQSHPSLRRLFDHDAKLRLIGPKETTEAAQSKIKEGDLDAMVEFLPATNAAAALAGNFDARITFNATKERSATAHERVSGIIADYRTRWLDREALKLGISPAKWQGFSISTQNMASPRQVGSFMLGIMLPTFFLVMVALGCFYPAIDATAGERERSTWETLLSTATSWGSIATAKYLYVTTFGGLAGLLNLAAVLVTMKPVLAPFLARAGMPVAFSIPPTSVPILVLAAVLLAGFVGAGMMIFASFARTFKEGQAMITPFYILTILPVTFLSVPGIKFSLPLALIPIANVTMMLRGALSGTLEWLPVAVTTASSLAVIAVCIRLATFVLKSEDVIAGSGGGGLLKLLKRRISARSRPGGSIPETP